MARTAHAAVLVKQERAVSLYGEGRSYDEIADELGYSHRAAAWKAVDRGLRLQRDIRADDYFQTQIDRYERILATTWDRATSGGDWKAAMIVLRVLERLDKLLRLGEGGHAVSQETIVLSADPEAYVAQLQQVVQDREHQARAARLGTAAQR